MNSKEVLDEIVTIYTGVDQDDKKITAVQTKNHGLLTLNGHRTLFSVIMHLMKTGFKDE